MSMAVTVLMSTYNGERYLREQIESIIAQKKVDVKLIVRDDGSEDGTTAILDDYQAKGVLSWYTGKNLRPAKSFMHLLFNSPDSDFYAFSDQDDVWMPDKLVTAVKALEAIDADLYYSSFTTVDSNLNVIQENVQHHSPDRLGAALVNLAVTGCTMVFSRRLLDAATQYTPARIMMHDSWLYKIALALDYTVVYDSVAHIYYRQHENNVIGAKGGIWKKWKARYNRWFNVVSNDRYNEAKELYDGYVRRMPASQRSILEPLMNYRSKPFFKRLKIAMSPAYRTGISSVDISFVLSFLAKRY